MKDRWPLIYALRKVGDRHVHPVLGLTRRGGRTAEKSGEGLDVTDIVVAGLLAEFAHRHVFDDAKSQGRVPLLVARWHPTPRRKFSGQAPHYPEV